MTSATSNYTALCNLSVWFHTSRAHWAHQTLRATGGAPNWKRPGHVRTQAIGAAGLLATTPTGTAHLAAGLLGVTTGGCVGRRAIREHGKK
eukprot:8088730-Pyramimonas_sp.AAC.2